MYRELDCRSAVNNKGMYHVLTCSCHENHIPYDILLGKKAYIFRIKWFSRFASMIGVHA